MAGQATFKGDRARAYASMEADLNLDEEFALDSGSQVNFCSPSAARRYFMNKRAANLKIVGVAGSQSATSAGDLKLTVVDENGVRFGLNCGVAFSLEKTPLNLLSVSALMKQGTVIHFENGNCWLKHSSSDARISIVQKGGLFLLPSSKLAAGVVSADDDGSLALGAAGVTTDHEADGLGLAQGTFAESALCRRLLTSALYGENGIGSEEFLGDSDVSMLLDKFGKTEAKLSLGASADVSLWHRRIIHKLQGHHLRKIWKENLVDGLSLKGNLNKLTTCGCMSCRMAKIRKAASHGENIRQPPTCPGERVSTDIKNVTTTSIGGYRYCVVFVDLYSGDKYVAHLKRLTDLVEDALKPYLERMKKLDVRVQLITSDRGSNYFSNNKHGTVRDTGAAQRLQSKFAKFLKDGAFHHGDHRVIPVESHEKRSESAFRELFQAADTLLFDARLTPALWPAAVSWAAYVSNRIPCLHRKMSPFTMLTQKPCDWSKIRVFGSSVIEQIPNDPERKTVGVPVGRHRIFVGFAPESSGYLLFDPVTRSFDTADSCIFNEDFSYRINSLRSYDKRRALLKKGVGVDRQPVVMNDYDDVEESKRDSVRDLYVAPDANGVHHLLDDGSYDPSSSPSTLRRDAHRHVEQLGLSDVQVGELPAGDLAVQQAPLSQEASSAGEVQDAILAHVPIRPLRTSVIGVPEKETADDLSWLWYARNNNVPIKYFQPCPKAGDSKSSRRYNKYMVATTLSESLSLGGSWADVKHDFLRGWIRFPKNENPQAGHIFRADAAAAGAGMVHVLAAQGLSVHPSSYLDVLVAKCLAVSGKTAVDVGLTFQKQLDTVYEAPVANEIFEDALEARRHSEACMRKVMWSDILDFSIGDELPPEPFHYKQTLEEYGCRESTQWASARKAEDDAISDFGAFKFVKASEAAGHQVLGSRYVYKRKIGKNGEVTKWKARLVIQGMKDGPNAQDVSHLSDRDLYAPTLHKDSLRLLLSLAAGKGYSVYQADIANAFLQGTLKYDCFVRPPDGMHGVPPGHLIKLLVPVYGLRSAPASFAEALSSHLMDGLTDC